MKSKQTTQPNTSIPQENCLEDIVAVRIVRMAEIIQRFSTHTIEERYGIRNTDMRILNVLENGKAMSVSDISRRTHVDKAWISRSLTQLEEKRLIKRTADKTDSRYTLIQLTKRGSNLLDKVRPQALANETLMLAGINGKKFKQELNRLLQNLEQCLVDVTTEK